MKQYTIIMNRRGRQTTFCGTLEELISKFSYTLETGRSWEHERGNKRINTHPATIRSLVSNLNNAENNAAANGYSGVTYELAQ